MLVFQYLLFGILIIAIAILSISFKKLSISGGVASVFVGLAVFAGGNFKGLAMLGAFFVLGTLATGWKKNEKLPLRAISDRSNARNAGQVLANGGVAALLAILALVFTAYADTLRLMIAAALSAATADTLSSELGMIYGRRYYNILSFKKEQNGLDGVVSIEGFLIGIVGSAVISIIYTGTLPEYRQFLLIIAAGTVGNVVDSILGVAFERRQYLGNDQVNFLNTLIAALFMLICILLFL